MTTSAFASQLAYFQEVTQGLSPANAAAWVSSGQQIRHVAESLDPSSIIAAALEDLRSQKRVHAVNRKVEGLRNVEFPFSNYITGSGVVTADSSEIVETPLMTLLTHALGGLDLNTSTTLAGGGHTASIVNVTAATGMVVGGHLAFELAADPGVSHIRRITDVSTLAITLDQDLPSVPADADLVHAMATIYIDPDVLIDSNGGGGPFTFSWLIQKGLAGALENFEIKGSKAMLGAMNFTRGELPTMDFNVMAANFVSPQTAPTPSWTLDPDGFAPVAIGPNTEIFFQDNGTVTDNQINVSEVTIDPGVPVIRVPTVTESQANMEGTCNYATGPADTLIDINIVPFNTDEFDDWDADTFMVFRLAKVAAAGSLFAVSIPNAEIAAYPARGTVDAVSSRQIQLRAHEETDTIATTDLWKSKIAIAIG